MKKHTMKSGGRAFLLLLFSLALALAGQLFIYTGKKILPGLIFHAAAIMAFIAADRGYRKRNPGAYDGFTALEVESEDKDKERKKPGRKEIAVFFLILITAAFFRFYKIQEIPIGCFRDEGKLAMDSVFIMQDKIPNGADSKTPVYIREMTDNPAAYNYIVSAVFKFSGSGVTEARAASGIIGMLAVISMYFLLRAMFGPAAAIAGGFFFSVMRWEVIFSRTVYHAGYAVFLIIPLLYFVYMAMKKQGIRGFVLLGFMTAFSVYSFQAARTVPLAVFFVIVYAAFSVRGFIWKNKAGIFAGTVVFAAVMLPLAVYIITHYAGFVERARIHFIFSDVNLRSFFAGKNFLQIYMENAAKVLLMFNYIGDKTITYNVDSLPMLDFITGALMMQGLGYTVYRFFTGSRLAGVLLIFFAVFLHGGILFVDAPHGTRTALVIPLLAVFFSVPFYRGYAYASNTGAGSAKRAAIIIFVLLAVAAAAENYHNYFIRFGKHPMAWRGFDTDTRKAAEYLVQLGPQWHGVMADRYMHGALESTYEFDIVMSKYRWADYERFVPGRSFPASPAHNKHVAYILTPDYARYVPVLSAMYPNARYVRVTETYAPSAFAFFVMEVPFGDIKNYRENMKYGFNSKYYMTPDWSGEPAVENTEPLIEFDWGNKKPLQGRFSAEWTGRLEIPETGQYGFFAATADYASVTVDNKPVYENRSAYRTARLAGKINLKKGIHNITVRYRMDGAGKVSLRWIRPGSGEEPMPFNLVKPR